jgi:hypothetical protein
MSQFDTPSRSEHGTDPLTSDDARLASPTTAEPSPPITSVTTSLPNQSDSTAAVASEQAKQVGQEAMDSGKQVAAVATDEVKSVAAEAGAQARNLLDEARSQLTDQASTQQNNIAAWLRSLVDELDQMLDRTDDSQASGGTATTLVRQVADRARSAAGWLEEHEPADLLTETSRFARQRPGLFLALAAVGGLLAGRLTRGLAADSQAQPPKRVAATDRPDSLGSLSTRQPGLASSGPAGGTAITGDYAAPELAEQELHEAAGERAWYDDGVGSRAKFAGAKETEVGRETR